MAHPPFRANQQKNKSKRNIRHTCFKIAKYVDYLIKEGLFLEQLIKKTDICLRKQNFAWPFASKNQFAVKL